MKFTNISLSLSLFLSVFFFEILQNKKFKQLFIIFNDSKKTCLVEKSGNYIQYLNVYTIEYNNNISKDYFLYIKIFFSRILRAGFSLLKFFLLSSFILMYFGAIIFNLWGFFAPFILWIFFVLGNRNVIFSYLKYRNRHRSIFSKWREKMRWIKFIER